MKNIYCIIGGKKREDGWTLMLSEAPLAAIYGEYFHGEAVHYLFSTIDTCIEVISRYPPSFKEENC
jgi:hypothetical protein